MPLSDQGAARPDLTESSQDSPWSGHRPLNTDYSSSHSPLPASWGLKAMPRQSPCQGSLGGLCWVLDLLTLKAEG